MNDCRRVTRRTLHRSRVRKLPKTQRWRHTRSGGIIGQPVRRIGWDNSNFDTHRRYWTTSDVPCRRRALF
ncbi:hypothetical protein C8039_19000 [Halogeometricum sp. wsp3]|nr:hypothetical protein C8039_19000 [Halogeometricum sp. wsp3]